MPRLKASAQGLIKIEQARKKKGWTKTDARACREASKILEPNIDWEDEQIKLDNIFANGASIASWKRFLKGISIRTEAFKAFCQILELDYLEICKDDLAKINVYLCGIFFKTNEDKIRAKLREVEKLLDGEQIILLKIEKGSIVLKLQSSIRAYEKLLALSQSGQLQEILGFPIENIELESVEPIDTREWLESLFNNSWQPTETVLATSSLRSFVTDTESSENIVSKAKIISLTETDNVAIVVNFTYLSEAEIQTDLEMYPIANLAYLPKGLVIEILDELDTLAIREEIGNYIDSMQIPFSFEPEEEFKVKLTLKSISIVENLFDD